MDQSFLALASGAVGAVIGLMAPLIANSLNQRGVTKDGQRAIANEILDLLGEAMPIDAHLGGRHSAARLKLYILGIRLRDETARAACASLVVAAGQDGASEDDLFPAWNETIKEVSRISRDNH